MKKSMYLFGLIAMFVLGIALMNSCQNSQKPANDAEQEEAAPAEEEANIQSDDNADLAMKCGDEKADEADEGDEKCGEGKCGEGKCGDEEADDESSDDEEAEEEVEE